MVCIFKMRFLQFLTQLITSSAVVYTEAGMGPWSLSTKVNHSSGCGVLPVGNQS